MTQRLEMKTALITGATGGIGAATARAFIAEGAHVALTDLDQDQCVALAQELDPSGEHALGLALDVTDLAAWEQVVAQVIERFGGLDILVNVAGILDWPGIEETEPAAWDRVIAVNQTGTWLGMRAAMPALRASGRASIINTSSILGLIGSGGAAAYQASKGAVRLLSKTAAVQYARQGIRVNSIHPGVIATPMIQDLLDAEGDQQADIARTPMRRAASPEEIAPAMVFLASDESSFMTGAELVIDGGLTAY